MSKSENCHPDRSKEIALNVTCDMNMTSNDGINADNSGISCLPLQTKLAWSVTQRHGRADNAADRPDHLDHMVIEGNCI